MNRPLTSTSTPVASPCTDACVTDRQNICTGCYRTIDEIIDWARLSESRKRDILVRCQQRKAEA
ncbi:MULTISPECIES: DUF1289 domain-containing protein [unclassified Lentimonas]|uniref:DUF1289 domain-containing protein n=1 Tax=unclassified Lentimonas TaxID=2630993 RepID=UPI00132783F1|nr:MULTISPECIES: DUF1289 domain-containing protein [unclassified Lentimonas]CAA6676891.1 FIG00992399: hypothetical protein [Lentimonas sp. CC4]CAA6686697.1 FIG00992399: hypothetical protein [Lentimonas sp. CC6]CAA6692953.1 FIG00992399: hypothetical protein [Lentimonas sp. CC10]CAA6695615.1 FIG00992399: hypothetical protein [Lentimonas sp. CC19]CAA7069943.1 FIG00992399: hypothetical protein [Lentimonas sp. CC11]